MQEVFAALYSARAVSVAVLGLLKIMDARGTFAGLGNNFSRTDEMDAKLPETTPREKAARFDTKEK